MRGKSGRLHCECVFCRWSSALESRISSTARGAMRIPAFRVAIIVYVVVGQALPAMAQVDRQRAEAYFKEVQALCERDGGRLWGVPLCGPMVIADLRTQTFATSQKWMDVQGGTGMGRSRRSTPGRLQSCPPAAVIRAPQLTAGTHPRRQRMSRSRPNRAAIPRAIDE
jgi:hypothetical protein